MPEIDLAAWLRPDEFDLYCIGAQEVEESPGTSLGARSRLLRYWYQGTGTSTLRYLLLVP